MARRAFTPEDAEEWCEGLDCQSTNDGKQPDIDHLMNTHLPVVAEPDQVRPGVSAHEDTEDEKHWIPGEFPGSPELDAECEFGLGFCECTEPICPGVTAAEISAREEIEQEVQEPANEDGNRTSPEYSNFPVSIRDYCNKLELTPFECEQQIAALITALEGAYSAVEVFARDTQDENEKDTVIPGSFDILDPPPVTILPPVMVLPPVTTLPPVTICEMNPAICECPKGVFCADNFAAEISARDEIEQGGQEPADEDRKGKDFIPPSPPAVEAPSVWEAVCAENPGLCEDPPFSPLPSWPPIADSGVEISARDTEDVDGENIVPLPPNFLSCTFSDGTLTCPDEPFESLCGPSNVPCAEALPPPPVSWPPPECAMDLCPGDEYEGWRNDLFNELFDRDNEIEQRQQEGENEEEPAGFPPSPGSLPIDIPAPVDIESMMRWLCVAPTLAHEYKYYCCLAEPGSQPIMCADFAQLPEGAIVEERPDAASA